MTSGRGLPIGGVVDNKRKRSTVELSRLVTGLKQIMLVWSDNVPMHDGTRLVYRASPSSLLVCYACEEDLAKVMIGTHLILKRRSGVAC